MLCVSWNDARAYAQWLSRKTAKRYRLPTEAEWEYAARAGSVAARYWGDDPVQTCRFANVADQSRFQTWGFGQRHECTDGHYFTAPAGGYSPNRFGLYDMLGNVWEWTEDCWNANYAGAPTVYGMFGQDYNVAIIAEAPGNAEYIGAIAPALMSGTFAAFKSIPLYTAGDVVKVSKIAKKVAAKYRPPVS